MYLCSSRALTFITLKWVMFMHGKRPIDRTIASFNRITFLIKCLSSQFKCVHFFFLGFINLWLMVLSHILVPIIHHSVSFGLLFFKINIFYIESSIVMKISKSYLAKLLSKTAFLSRFSWMLNNSLHCALSTHSLSRLVRNIKFALQARATCIKI